MYGTYMKMLFILKCMDLYSALPGLKLGDTGTLPSLQEIHKVICYKVSFFLPSIILLFRGMPVALPR